MRALSTIGSIAVALTVAGQCGMTATFDINVQCGSVSTLVQVSGGVAPYTIQFFGRQAGSSTFFPLYTRTITSGNTHSENPPFQFTWSSTEQARVTVTDVNGCVTTTTSPVYTARIIPSTQTHKVLDCATGQYWLEVSWNYGTTPLWSTFQLDFGPTASFASNWTQSTPFNRYRYNSPLTPGSHTLNLSSFVYNGWEVCAEMTNFFIPGSITPGDCGVNVQVRAALDGALPSGTIMTTALRAANLIPTSEPYSSLGYTYTGSPANVSISPSLLAITGNNAIVDWVVVELRSTATTVAYSKPALLQADGDVIDTDGDTYLNFPIPAGDHYVAIRHRDHLGIMTATTRALNVDPSSGTNLIDFRLSSTITYGTDARVQKGAVWCLWAGDATGNGTIRYTGSANDRDPILLAVGGTTPNNTVPNVYDRRDTNLDGVIKYTGTANDRDIILTNVGSTTPNNTRTQQLP
jgi:hypothetical protein